MKISKQHYLDWLAAIYVILKNARKGGLKTLDGELGRNQGNESCVFAAYPETIHSVYYEFAEDLVRMIAAGSLSSIEMEVYAEAAMQSYESDSEVCQPLMKCIWLCFWASLSGWSPQWAVEVGRQAIPAGMKVSYAQLLDVLNALAPEHRPVDPERGARNARVEEFVRSLA